MAPPIQCYSLVQVGTFPGVPKTPGDAQGPPHLHSLPITSAGDGWLLKAVSLGPWVHMIEELQVFDQEPVESLVLSRSKVLGWATRAALLSAVPSSQHPGF